MAGTTGSHVAILAVLGGGVVTLILVGLAVLYYIVRLLVDADR